MRDPTFLFIGPDKSGSTWLHEILRGHPQCFVPMSKDLYFFDRYYERGLDWYRSQFRGASNSAVAIGEISHDYLFCKQAAQRIRRHLPGVKLLTCLRDPVDRTMSQYLYMRRNGLTRKPLREALEEFPFLVTNSLYHRHLSVYFDLFPESQIKILLFDDLKTSPRTFAADVFDSLDIDFVESLPYEVKSRPASKPRNVTLARFTKTLAGVARSAGLEDLVGWVKRGPVQRLLYKPYTESERPQPNREDTKLLAEAFGEDLTRLSELVQCELPSWAGSTSWAR